MYRGLIGLGMLVLVLLVGCSATPQTNRLLNSDEISQMSRQELTHTPFFPQDEYQCGPAALAMLLGTSDVIVSPEALVSKVYVPALKGSLQIEMTAAAREQGRVAYADTLSMEQLLALIEQGQPVLVMQNLGLEWIPRWHYAVVIGFDPEQHTVILRSGETERYEISMRLFERTWKRADYWGLLALNPNLPPPSVLDSDKYFYALADFSLLHGGETLWKAWALASTQWPQHVGLKMGLANSFYDKGEHGAAITILRELLSEYPDYAPGLNNLAHILKEQGQLQAAINVINKALAVSGISDFDRQLYEKTRSEIEQAIALASKVSLRNRENFILEQTTTPLMEQPTRRWVF